MPLENFVGRMKINFHLMFQFGSCSNVFVTNGVGNSFINPYSIKGNPNPQKLEDVLLNAIKMNNLIMTFKEKLCAMIHRSHPCSWIYHCIEPNLSITFETKTSKFLLIYFFELNIGEFCFLFI